MLTDDQKRALTRWYSQDHVLERARAFIDAKRFDQLEDYLHKGCLMPLGRHDSLPDFMKDEQGETLFPTNLDPRADIELWQDAVEVCWEVMRDRIGVAHDDVHRNIAQAQQSDWDSFMKSIEERKKQRSGAS